MKSNSILPHFFFIFLFAFSCFSSEAQVKMNYYDLIEEADSFYSVNPSYAEQHEGDYNHYLRWKEFWRNRVYGVDSANNGNLDLCLEKFEQYISGIEYYQRSTSIASNWTLLGPVNVTRQVNGLVSCLWVDTINDPTLNTIYLGTNASGIWKTTDGGSHWINITDNLDIPNLGIMDIQGDPSDGSILYAATGGNGLERFLLPGYSFGILKSTNYGASWNIIKPETASKFHLISKLFIDPSNTQRIYALIDSLVFRSQDGGNTWSVIFNEMKFRGGVDIMTLRDIEMKPGDPNTIYIASDDYYGWHATARAEVWKTTNATSETPSWIRIDTLFNPLPLYDTVPTTERYELAVSDADPDALFVIYNPCGDTYGAWVHIWKSENSGNSFRNMFWGSAGAGVDFHRLELLVSPTDTGIVYVGGYAMARLNHWTLDVLTNDDFNYYHIDTRAASIIRGSVPDSSGNNDILLVGNDGGISKSTDGSINWTNINGEGLVINQFWGIGGSRNAPHFIAGGTQDNAFFSYLNNYWMHSPGESPSGADMGNVVVGHTSADTIYGVKWNCGTSGAGIIKSANGGISWSHLDTIPGIGNVAPNRPLTMNPLDGQKIYVGGHNLGRTVNGGNTWYSIQVPSCVYVDATCSALAIAPSDTSIIFMAYRNPIWDNIDTTKIDTVKLIKRENGNWINLTYRVNSQHPYLRCYAITDIAISNTSHDSVWISFGGFNNQYHPARVLFSPDGGLTWDDYSDALPDMPVNRIIYHNNSNGGLFAATDAGVFYRDNTLPEWQPFNYNLPQAIVLDLEINDSLQLLRAGTFGRGIYESDISCHFSEDPLVISSDTTWRTIIEMDRSIEIDSGATLTIQGTVKLPTRAKIYVKQGAKLVLDGGTLTNKCFYNWQGIEVWGHSDLPQWPVSNQGFVWMKNGATLQNSRIGISTCKTYSDGRINWSTTGGLILADSAFFMNNYKAVQFLSYRGTQSSYFRNVVFETNRKIIDGYYSYPSDFVSLNDVNAVRFLGCAFRNTTMPTGSVPEISAGRGIYSENGAFIIDEWCKDEFQPCVNYQSCTFSGLYNAVKALFIDPTKMVRVNNTVFHSNKRGIYLGAIDYPLVTSNKFYLPGRLIPNPSDTLYGLYLDHSSGYFVQENEFRAMDLNKNGNTIGIVVNHSGTEPNEIYNNRFDSVYYGIIAQDQNRSSDGMTGLVLKCNNYTNTRYDKVISLSDTSVSNWGIALYQGDSLSQTGPAGNTFSPQHSSGVSDIDNSGARFKYYHHAITPPYRLAPQYYSNVTVRSTGWLYINKSTCCPSGLNGGVGSEDLKQEIAGESDTINLKQSALTALVDGGNTDSLNSEIISSIPIEALELRGQLLSKSPYLSDTTMQSAISKEGVLPNEMIRDVLVANPQSATSDKVIEELNNRFIPMPDSMLAEILAGEEFVSAKEALESELSSHKAKMGQALYDLIRLYKSDTVNPSSRDSLIILLQNQPDLASKYQLSFEYLNAGDTNSLNTALSSIPNAFTLSSQQGAVHNDYILYFAVHKKLIKNRENIYTLDSLSLSTIQSLYTTGTEPVKSLARNILIASGSLNYHEPILLPDELKSATTKKQYKTGKFIEKSYMKVFPNPANQYIIVEYNLKDKGAIAIQISVQITSLQGYIIDNFNLRKKQDEIMIITNNYKPGFYICSLKVNGKVIDNVTFTIIR